MTESNTSNSTDSLIDQVNLFTRFENPHDFSLCTDADRSLPVTLIVGELGAGKTSLVRRLLTIAPTCASPSP
jgi:ABC-type Mn2+/Zn2+ transport system ATPase subunit